MRDNKKYFYGEEISEYGVQNGYVDYRTLAKCFEAVLNNNIMQATADIGYWEQVNGFIDHDDEISEKEDKINKLEDVKEYLQGKMENSDDDDKKLLYDRLIEKADGKQDALQDEIYSLEHDEDDREIFQYYIVDDNGADILKRETNEILFYNEELDMYIWGVTHWGTSWDYVLTDININKFYSRYN